MSDDPGEVRESIRAATRELAIDEFRRISSLLVGAPHAVRVRAANELMNLAPLLGLEELYDLAESSHPGERVGAAIGLGVYARESISDSDDAQVRSALHGLLVDHFSRVRYRAVKAVDGHSELTSALRPELRRLADNDPNEFVRDTARKVLARADRVE